MNGGLLDGAKAMATAFGPTFFAGLAVLAGFVLIGQALITLVHAADARAQQSQGGNPWARAGFKLLIGGMLLRFTTTMGDVSQMLFGTGIQSPNSVMAYMPSIASAGPWKMVLEVCLLWVVMIGWAAALVGFMKWNAAANGSGGGGRGDEFWAGLWHIVGGAAAINLSGAVSAFLGK